MKLKIKVDKDRLRYYIKGAFNLKLNISRQRFHPRSACD